MPAEPAQKKKPQKPQCFCRTQRGQASQVRFLVTIYIYHVLVFTNGGNSSGEVEYAIQIGDTTTFDVRGKYTISADGIIKTSYEEQIKDGTWGAIDEGRVDQDQFQYVMSDGKITELYRVNDDGELTDRFYQLE